MTDHLIGHVAGTCRYRWHGSAPGTLDPMQRQRFDLLDVLPAVLHGVVLDFNWSRELLWDLDLPVEQVAVAELRWLLAMPVWSFEGKHFQVSPDQVRADPARHQLHYAQALAANLAFPLHVLVWANRMTTVLDGFHRLLKADLLGQQIIMVKKLPEQLLDTIACTYQGAGLQTIGAQEPTGHLTSTVAVSRVRQRVIDPAYIPRLSDPRPLRPELEALLGVRRLPQLKRGAGDRSRLWLSGAAAVLGCCTALAARLIGLSRVRLALWLSQLSSNQEGSQRWILLPASTVTRRFWRIMRLTSALR